MKYLSDARFRVGVSAVLAALSYGAWAFIINFPINLSAALRAGVIQGVFALFMTFSNSGLIELFFAYFKRKQVSTYWVPVVLPISIALVSLSLQLLNQTPNPILTVLPGFIVGFLFNFAYHRVLQLQNINSNSPR